MKKQTSYEVGGGEPQWLEAFTTAPGEAAWVQAPTEKMGIGTHP